MSTPATPKKPRAKKAPAGSELRIEYMTLDELRRFPGNPKAHDAAAIGGSVERFGFRDPLAIDERTGLLSEGHGRLDVLEAMRAEGKAPPDGVKVDGEAWRVPVERGGSFKSKAELERYIVAHNQTTIAGGWGDGAHLAGILRRAQASGVAPSVMGFGAGDVTAILARAAASSALPPTGPVPPFQPVGVGEQGKLDQKIHVTVTCPHCKGTFER